MSDWEFIEYDPVTNRGLFARDVPGGIEIKTEYYVDEILDENVRVLNAAEKGWKGEWHRVASISPGLAYGDSYLARALKANDDKAISKFLNDSDNRKWRTKEGKV